MKRNTEPLIDTSKEVRLEVNAEIAEYRVFKKEFYGVYTFIQRSYIMF
jgi:hypothetical protein